MTTVAADQLVETIQNLQDSASAALKTEDVKSFVAFESFVNEVEAYVREVQQSMWADQAKATIRNLEKGVPPTEVDKDLIRTFLVCDAERYLKHENNYGDWKSELQRLMKEVTKRAGMIDQHSIGDLRGILKDAIRLVPDIRNYLEEQERVEKLSSALNELDPPACAMLARLLKEQLHSADR